MDAHSIAVVGLGYVGLPLAAALAAKHPVVGYDIDTEKVAKLQSSGVENGVRITGQISALSSANIFIITVPTPIDQDKKPDLTQLLLATKSVAEYLKPGALVIFESTVYPGCTEEACVPVLEKFSGLKYNQDFFVGYSPERINVGDQQHTLTNTVKITSGSTPEAAAKVDELYKSIITAGTYPAPSIKVAEAAKAIENAQRDLNISFVNELSLMFDKMGIDTHDVLDAAATKWNFHKYTPGLVGGHCIGVDPYYLSYKATQIGIAPQVISSGRRVNEGMAEFVAQKLDRLLQQKGKQVNGSRLLVLGITFKENCDDVRNSGVIALHRALASMGAYIDLIDPNADAQMVKHEYSLHLQTDLNYSYSYDAIILAVPHKAFEYINFLHWKQKGSIIFDIKGTLDRNIADARL
ncbi:MAG: nucleotide sugar dehydrogenase [Edaphocola sp.]